MSGLVVMLLIVAFIGGVVRHVVVAQLAEHAARCPGHPAPASALALDPAVLRLAATLTHPDRHPQERQANATRVTAQLLSAYGAARRSS